MPCVALEIESHLRGQTATTYYAGSKREATTKSLPAPANMAAFQTTIPLRLSTPRPKRASDACARRPPSLAIDPVSIGTGYALLDSLKGVVIGPTVNEITAAIAGGTVGVMGTIIALEVRRQKVKERKQCPYCRGTGKLPCGHCYTLGTVPSGSALTSQIACSTCGERGYLECNHCDGDGRLIPWLYERAIRAQYEDYVYTALDDYYQDGPPYV